MLAVFANVSLIIHALWRPVSLACFNTFVSYEGDILKLGDLVMFFPVSVAQSQDHISDEQLFVLNKIALLSL